MAGQERTSPELEAFARHLDGYGGGQERWPDSARRRFGPLLAAEAEARRLLEEARALDRLLDQAPMPVADRVSVLADRIAALAAASPAGKGRPPAGLVVDLTQARRARAPSRLVLTGAGLRVAAAMAASLLLGLYLGSSPAVISTVEAAAGVVGLTDRSEGTDLALFEDGTDSGGEDLL